MRYVNRKDTQHKSINKGPNPKYRPRRMEKFTDKEIKSAIRVYERALKNCKDELRDRQNKRDRD